MTAETLVWEQESCHQERPTTVSFQFESVKTTLLLFLVTWMAVWKFKFRVDNDDINDLDNCGGSTLCHTSVEKHNS